MSLRDSFRVFLRNLVKFFVVIAVLYAALWAWFNWGSLREQYDAKYLTERYGVVWYTDLGAARTVAANHGRKLMIVCIHSGAKHEMSDLLISRIFPSPQFRGAAETCVPVLADLRQGVEEDISARNSCDEITSNYNLRNRYGVLVLADAKGEELRRVEYAGEPVSELLEKLSGGKFTPLPPFPRPAVKSPAAAPKPAAPPAANPKDEKPKVEEKWGFSTGL